MANKFYAVKVGLKPDIYESWHECEMNVKGYPGAIFKSFKSRGEAEAFMGVSNSPSPSDITMNAKSLSTPYLSSAETMISNGECVAYVDGSYSDKILTPSYGIVLLTVDGRQDYSGIVEDTSLYSMRNVAGEIEGARQAMLLAVELGLNKITIYHDYQGISSWCIGEWKTNKEGTIAYKKLYQETIKLIDIEFKKIKGHSGVYYNDEADKLAKKALSIY